MPITDQTKQTKLNDYNNKLAAVKTAAEAIEDDAKFDTEFKKLPLIVDYQPHVGGKSRHKNNKNNKNNKKNKSRRRNQSKRQRK